MVDSGNVHQLELDGRHLTLVGTAHISRSSVEEVKQIIDEQKPDTVCVELCGSRYESLKNRDNWQEMDILKVCLLYTSPSPRDRTRSRMPSSA